MPRHDAITFSDLIGKLDVVRIACDKCERSQRYQVRDLIKEHGRDAKIIDWLDKLTAHCPMKRTGTTSDQCGARCPNLPKVLSDPA